MLLLRELRAPVAFQQGQRRAAVWVMASLLVLVRRSSLRARKEGTQLTKDQERVADMSDRDILGSLVSLRDEFASVVATGPDGNDNGPTKREIAATLRDTLKRSRAGKLSWNMQHQTLADMFRITAVEAAEFGTSNDASFPHYVEGGASVSQAEPLTRDALAAKRREFLSPLVQGGQVPSLRVLRARLSEVGLDASPTTIQKDLDALGVTNPRTRGSRQEHKLQGEAPLFAEAKR